MFGSLGLPEILFILVLALLVFGPRRLPEVGRTVGRALGEFRRATGDLKRSFDQETSSFEQAAKLDPPATVPRPDVSTQQPQPDDSGESDAGPEAEDDSEDREES